jgi:hypothetical protein
VSASRSAYGTGQGEGFGRGHKVSRSALLPHRWPRGGLPDDQRHSLLLAAIHTEGEQDTAAVPLRADNLRAG